MQSAKSGGSGSWCCGGESFGLQAGWQARAAMLEGRGVNGRGRIGDCWRECDWSGKAGVRLEIASIGR